MQLGSTTNYLIELAQWQRGITQSFCCTLLVVLIAKSLKIGLENTVTLSSSSNLRKWLFGDLNQHTTATILIKLLAVISAVAKKPPINPSYHFICGESRFSRKFMGGGLICH